MFQKLLLPAFVRAHPGAGGQLGGLVKAWIPWLWEGMLRPERTVWEDSGISPTLPRVLSVIGDVIKLTQGKKKKKI